MRTTRTPPSGKRPRDGDVWPALWELFESLGPEVRRIVHAARLTLPQFVLLKACERGPISAKELAHRSDRTAPAITFVTGDLVATGLLRRVPSKRDRRRVGFSLTPRGRAALRRVHQEGARWDRDLTGTWSRRDRQRAARVITDLARRVASRLPAPSAGTDPDRRQSSRRKAIGKSSDAHMSGGPSGYLQG